MKKLKRLAIVALCVLCVTAGALADDVVKDITAQLRPDFTIEIDGEIKTFADVNGKTVYPVLYEGTTYLPIRAIGNIMGKDVQWDQDAKKVTLSNPTQESNPETAAVLETVNEYFAACRAADFDKASQYRSDNAGFLEMKMAVEKEFDNSIFANHKDDGWRIIFAILNRATQTIKFEPISMFPDGDGYKVSGKYTFMDMDNLSSQFDPLMSDENMSAVTETWIKTGKLTVDSTEEEIINVVIEYIVDEMVKIINNNDIPLITTTEEYKVINKDGKWVIDMSGDNLTDGIISAVLK